MATRAEINRKYGVSRLMPPDIANEELSPEQEALYEGQIKLVSDNFDKLWFKGVTDNVKKNTRELRNYKKMGRTRARR